MYRVIKANTVSDDTPIYLYDPEDSDYERYGKEVLHIPRGYFGGQDFYIPGNYASDLFTPIADACSYCEDNGIAIDALNREEYEAEDDDTKEEIENFGLTVYTDDGRDYYFTELDSSLITCR